MPEQPEQNYANHVMLDKALLVQLILMLGLVIAAGVGVGLARLDTPSGPCILGTIVLLHALLALTVIIKMRFYAIKLQDRIIRLEMQVRLDKTLPEALAEKARALTIPQLVGLRFASDAEMPGLIEQVFADNIESPDTIKKLVKDWQPDHHRV